MSHPQPPVKKLKLLPLAAVIFLTVSGGPYGLEPLLVYAGKNAALLLLIITPMLWDIPTILVVLELNGMMPVSGGYYQWVKRALGLRMALYEGWWTWLYTFVDLAIYPVLFVEYLAFFFPEAHTYKLPICLCIIWASAALNIRGIVPVGKTSMLMGAMVLTPFLILFGVAVFKHTGAWQSMPALSFQGMGFSSFGLALYTVMWNFLGWDSTTTYADEVHRPVKTYLSSIAIAFVLVMLLYVFTILTAQRSGLNAAAINDQGFPALGTFLGGHWLGALLAAGGMASTLGIYSAVMLSVSRVPKVMADDGLMPKALNRLHQRFNTPYLSIIVCSLVVSVMVMLTFTELIVLDVTLYGAGLILEYIALIVLRFKCPHEARPFRIPLNITGLCLLVMLPIGVYGVAITAVFMQSGSNLKPLSLSIGLLLTAELLWRYYKWRKQKLS